MQMLFQQLPMNQNFTIPSELNSSFVLLNIALDLTSDEAALFFLPENITNQRKKSTQRSSNGQKKEILIAELNRVSGGVRSINLSIQFGVGERVILKSLGGTVHIIGGYKKYQQAIQPNSQQPKEASYATQSKQVKNILNQKQDTPVINKPSSLPVEKSSLITSDEIEAIKKIVIAAAPQGVQPLRRSTRARAPPKPVQRVSKKAAKKEKQQLKSMASYFQCNLDDQDESFSKSDEEVEDDDDDDSDSQSQQQEQIQKNLRSGRKLSSKDIQEAKRRRNSSILKKSEQTEATAQIEQFSVPTKNPYV